MRQTERYALMTGGLAAMAVVLAGATMVHAVTVPTRLFFSHGSSSAYATGQIIGEAARQYVLAVNADQKVSVKLDTSDPSLRFDVTPADRKEPLYAGRSATDLTWSGTLPAEGEYIISVYTVRADARPDQKATYKLIVTLL
jgi:hypothetical protein